MRDWMKFVVWLVGFLAVGCLVGCLGLLIIVGAFFNPMTTPKGTEMTQGNEMANEAPARLTPASQPSDQQPPATPTPTATVEAPVESALDSSDPLLPSLQALGFSSRQELWDYFEIKSQLQDPRDLATCPGEVACVRLLGEKDANNVVIGPFEFNNKTSVTFDGWECAGSPTGQAKVEPGYHSCVEGVTIRPWR